MVTMNIILKCLPVPWQRFVLSSPVKPGVDAAIFLARASLSMLGSSFRGLR